MSKHASRCALLAAAVLCASTLAGAQTLYKLIDKNGKVTYSEKAPKDFDGKVIRIDVDPKANTATLPKAPPAEQREAARQDAKASDERAASARGRLEAAKKALEDARNNPRDGDVTWIGNKSGGTRPQPSEDYQKRRAQLERDVKDAEAERQKAERR